MLLLNRSNRVIGIKEVSSGGMTGTVIDPKLVFSVALKSLCTGIILCHNHPSGGLKPSEAVHLIYPNMCCTEKTEEKALFELAKALKHFYNLEDMQMNPGDLHTANVAEKLVRSIIEDNGYMASYLKKRGTRLFKFRR